MKKNFIISCIALSISFASCKKVIDIQPQNNVASDKALQDVYGYQSVLISVYDRLQDFGYYGRDLALMGDVLADNAFAPSALGTRYQSQGINSRGAHYNIWSNAYSGINELNTILASIDNVNASAGAQTLLKQQVKSEALALRGLIYFDIARIYGFEPNTIPTSGTDAGFNKSAVLRTNPVLTNADQDMRSRSTVDATYAQIEKDLQAAITSFQAYSALPGYAKPSSPYRITESATHALLGKVYLYERKYANAVTEFDNALNSAINFSRMATAGGYVSAFKAIPNPESLFEIAFNQAIEMSGVTGQNNSLFTYTQPNGQYNAASLQTFGNVVATAELVNLFEAGDDRKAMFFNSRSSIATVYTWANKYTGANGSYTDNVPVMRYSDVVLMKAEALAGQGQYAAAAALVVNLRANRNASTATVPTNSGIVNFIQDERRRELFFEGHRWFDLKRLGNGITKSAVSAVGTIPNTDYRILAPLPSAEVTLNPSLPQNPNY